MFNAECSMLNAQCSMLNEGRLAQSQGCNNPITQGQAFCYSAAACLLERMPPLDGLPCVCFSLPLPLRASHPS